MTRRLIFPKTNIMISFKSKFFNINCQYNQYFYKEDIKHLNYAVIICPKCGAVGFFRNHGKYDRYLFNCSNERFCIQRIRCEKCNSTHALLPDVIIPYRYFSAPFLLKVFTLFLIDKISIPQIAEMLKLSIPTFCKLIRDYKSRHKERMSIINPEFMNPLDHKFLIDYFHAFYFLFMQSSPHNSNSIFHGMTVT